MIQKNELPSWFCTACGKTYYDDNFQELGCECPNCGAKYQLGFTMTKTAYNEDDTYADEIICQKEKDDKKRD